MGDVRVSISVSLLGLICAVGTQRWRFAWAWRSLRHVAMPRGAPGYITGALLVTAQ